MSDAIQAKVDRLLNAGSLDAVKQELSNLTVEELSALLTNVGGQKISEEQIRKDIQNGAPTNPDGTVNFMNYSAWSVKECGHGN